MRTYARLLLRLRYVVVAAWFAAAFAAATLLPGVGEERGAPLEGLVAADSPPVRTELRSAELFEVPVLTRTVIVQRDEDGLSPATLRRSFAAAVEVSRDAPDPGEIAFALPVTNTLALPPASRESSTTLLTYLFFLPEAGLSDQRRLAHDYVREHLDPERDAVVGVTGAVPARLDQFAAIKGALSRVEVVTVGLIALILALNFRAFAAPAVALVSAGIGYAVATRAVAVVGDLIGVAVPRELEPLILVLLLGIVTDYAIFFLAAFRRRLAEGAPRLTAMEETVVAVGPIVLTAGLIVAAGTAALLAGTLDFFRAFGPGMALTALVGMAVAMTLVPASFAIFGRALFWPSLGRAEASSPERSHAGLESRGIAARVARSRWTASAVVLVTVAVLLGAATGFRDLRLGFTLITGLPDTAEAKQAAVAASRGFAPGLLAPTTIVLEGDDVAERRAELARLERLITAEEGVAAVIGPRAQPRRLTLGALLSEKGDAARYLVVFNADPGGGRAIEDLRSLQADFPRLLFLAGLPNVRAGFAGDTALAAATVGRIRDDLERIGIAVLVANLVLLVVFLRSLVAPLFLLAASVLALAASLGIATYVFQGLLGHEELTYYVPFAAAVLLVSLGSDYNIFVAGRIWDEARMRPLREAIAVAAPRASRAIAVASIALAASFAALALVPLRPFREFAFVMAVGVLLDSFVVRSLLVPAMITLVGDVSAWPRRRRTGATAARDAGG